jgi:hypothetical protein
MSRYYVHAEVTGHPLTEIHLRCTWCGYRREEWPHSEEQSTVIHDLVAALERLGSCEAFLTPRVTNEEDRARMDYARAALAAVPGRHKEEHKEGGS